MLSILLFQYILLSISSDITQNEQIEESQTEHFPFLDSIELFIKENIYADEAKVFRNKRKIFNDHVNRFKRNHSILKHKFDKEIYLRNHILLTEITNVLKNIIALRGVIKENAEERCKPFLDQYDELCKLQNSMDEDMDRMLEECLQRRDSL